MRRFITAVEMLGSLNAQVAMVSGGFVKHLRRRPLPDEELIGALTMAQSLITQILDGPSDEQIEALESGAEVMPLHPVFMPVPDDVGESDPGDVAS